MIIVSMPGSGCSDQATDPPVSVQPTFSSIRVNIFAKNCATSSCHSTLWQRGGLDLEGDAAYNHLVGVPPTTLAALDKGMLLVSPGKPDSSFLLVKLTDPAPEEGERMPSSNERLSDQEIEAIRTWIANGAQRD